MTLGCLLSCVTLVCRGCADFEMTKHQLGILMLPPGNARIMISMDSMDKLMISVHTFMISMDSIDKFTISMDALHDFYGFHGQNHDFYGFHRHKYF